MRTAAWALLLLLAFVFAANAGELRHVAGRVVDEKGKPVKDAAIDYRWRAFSPTKDSDGKAILPKSEEDARLFWAHEGKMEPWRTANSGADGRFSIEMPDSSFTLMALDAQRARGGLTAIPKNDDGAEIEIRIEPLVRVKGTIEGPPPGQRPSWAHVWMSVPEDPTRPLHVTRLVECGSFEARFEMSLPPGRYLLDSNNDDDPRGAFDKEITLTADTPEVDLGPLALAPVTRLSISQQIKQSQTSGAMGDYTKHYGERLPAWHIVDARGVDKNVQLADFQGKWVLIDFWATSCIICLKSDLPKLAKFYEDHKAQRDQFEILAICIDCTGEMKSLADVDRALEPVVQHVWGGKPLPFPLLLDTGMTTLERFGVPGYETILIDPDGKLVEGDEAVLAEKLKK